ncbi:MAG: ATP-binding cassette domain-containing protein [Candidatus Manganitrophaceae bacterium]|nr:MAG: ATP-binding cassette domain-containing protein [Candidatus Manganitrophaceae bacterium]
MNIVEIQKATVYQGAIQVFSDLSLEIAAGAQTAILGPNGAGKSTLLKLLCGESRAVDREGSAVRLFGQERWNVWELRAQLGIVSHDLQRDHLDGVRGVEVILSGYYASIGVYGHQEFGAAQRKRAGEVMEMLGIAALQERRFFEMSTGEQRRFLLGRALVHDPGTLILDEPTSGLDLRASFQYLDLVRSLIRRGKTLLLVTHHLHEIPPEVERVILLKAGRVVADGKKSEVLTRERLTALFDTPVEIAQAHGWYQALPAF